MDWIVSKIGGCLEGLILDELNYLFSSASNVRNMHNLMKQLNDKRENVTTHKARNDRNTFEVPSGVPEWLKEVDVVDKEVKEIISRNDNNGWSNLIVRYQVGKKSADIVLRIEELYAQEFTWTDASKPLGRVDTKRASTSKPSHGDIEYGFKSRDTIFQDALKYLHQDNDTQVIALCGMGGVGKTTMMKQLKKVVEDNKMFDWVMKVDIGRDFKPDSFLHAIEGHFSISPSNEDKTTRVVRVRKMFEKISEKEKDKTLIILDDVWGKVELEDVGLSPLPKGFKFLLTSRYTSICQSFAIQADLRFKVLEVNALEEKEAHEFLLQITNISQEFDQERYQLGVEIVKKCSYLPFAIKLIAPTLINQDNAQWRNTRDSLKDNADIQEIVKESYNYLENKECKEILLLCGLFPEDSNIAIDDLTRYAWGLKLLDKVSKYGAAGDRIEAHVSDLKKVHLLIDGDYRGYVKMHDVVLDFVLVTISDGDHASIIKHGDMSELSDDEMNKSYKRISLSGEVTGEILEGIKCPNLLFFRLMHEGHDKVRLPEGFYENMKNLEVIELTGVHEISVLRSLQCSINLRTLRLFNCSLGDCSSIGNLSKLEVLSINYCEMSNFPSSFGNLKKLKVLDLNCFVHFRIADGVLKNFLKLEELYLGNVWFTEGNSKDLAVRSMNLSALEISCYRNEGQLNNMHYENLKKFNICVGRLFGFKNARMYFWRNTLSLVINKDEFLKTRMNVLLKLTEELSLKVDEMSNLEDIEGKSLPQYSSFCNLRILKVWQCVDLRNAFTMRVATNLPELEHLDISSCDSMEELIHSSGSQRIELPKLKILSLEKLPNLLRLCNTVNVIELPQLTDLQLDGLPNFTSIFPKKKWPSSSMKVDDTACRSFLSEEVVVPKLETLKIHSMKNLKDLWPCEYSTYKEADVHNEINEIVGTQTISNTGGCSTSSNEGNGVLDTTMEFPRLKSISVPWLSSLKKLYIFGCDSLKHIFTFATLESLGQLHALTIQDCMAMDVILKKGIEDQTYKHVEFPCLRYICLQNLQSLKGFFLGINKFKFPLLDDLMIDNCPQITVFTVGCSEAPNLNSIRTKFERYSVECFGNIHKTPCSSLGDTCLHLTTSEGPFKSFGELIEVDKKRDHHVETIIPNDELLRVKKLEKIYAYGCDSVKYAFEALEGKDNEVEFPKLKEVKLEGLQRLEYLWKSNQRMVLKFPSLTKVTVGGCGTIEHVFTTSMIGSILQLQELSIYNCKNMEVIVKEESMVHEKKEEYDARANEITLPHLKSLSLYLLPSLKGFCLGKEAFSWPLLNHLVIGGCPELTVFTNGHLTTPKLNVIHTNYYHFVASKDPNSFVKTTRGVS